MTIDELVSLFSLDRVGVANPKFDRAKLLDFNTKACAAATPQRLLAAFFVLAGAMLFLRPRSYEAMMPPYLSWHCEAVAISGAGPPAITDAS